MAWRYVLLFVAVFSSSVSVIFIRMSETNPVVLSSLRLLVASLLLIPVFLWQWRRHHARYTRQHWQRTLVPSVLLAVHFSTWAYGARMTAAAQASLIVNLVPIAMPFLLHWLVNERINRVEVVGTTIAIAGVILLTAPGALASGGDFLGNVICFGSMLLVAAYVALGRRNRDFPSLWLYVIPIYFQAGVLCLIASIPWLGAFGLGTSRDWLWIFALACVPTIMGHTLLNYSVRHLRGQLVGLSFASQFIFPAVIAFYVFGEKPPAVFYISSVLVLAGIALVVLSAPTPPPPPAAVE